MLLEAPWGRPGLVLMRLGGVLAVSWTPGGVLGVPWWRFGGCWSRAAAQLAFFVAVALDAYQRKAIWNGYIDSLFVNALPVPMLDFFIGFPQGFIALLVPGVSQDGAPTWTSFWEASWSDFGRGFGSQDAPKTAQDDANTTMMTSFSGSIFWWTLHVILGGCLGACWGRLGVVLGSVLGRLEASWANLLWFALRFWIVLDGLDGFSTSFESMLARCLGMLRLSSRFAGFRRVSAERFPRCASTASRE